jgi:membrane carboxypeptidase/penicillin-binding protein PbpC
VSDKSGETMMEWKDSDGKEATTPELATTITNILIDDAARAYIFGAGGSLTLPGRPVAAKTGTTNNYKDAWTMGYTPSIATGVWVGNTKPSPMKGGGVKLAGIIWNQFMREATKDTPVENFDSPPANDATKPVLNGSDGGIKIKINSLNGKIATENTPPGLVVEKTYLPPHDILHYVSREDPRGSAPASPQDDPQYESWEIALQNWAERQTASGNVVSFEEPPTERDTTNSSPDLAPTVKILSPASGETISGRQVDMRVEASAPRGVKKVYYIIDGKQVGESSEFPFAFSYTIDKLYSQQHVLKIMAMDETGNAGVAESVFFINDPLDPPNVIWKDGNIIELTKEDFPRVVKLAPIRWDSANTLKIQLISETKTKNIYSFNTKEDQLNEQGTLEFTWKTFPGPGSYTLKAIIADKSGHTEESNLVVNIK